ncbi:phage tail protein [Bradyrhizobium guangzhouense]|uniref:Phage tail protein n=1 Tax=Bradyrhizobium guangzhouense TaxID=1325095 RepID=A0AAE5X077_9BRAD|nr:tail fiber protein [Bradyrhizobium guangzhouense]QAU46354.1 phage tail protein [Bradyrhizobium guangzhouense]RXH13561.1 phage tail protein [Bradyrhizobium guangzhouense]RXH15356.1 phage tail protein [Bradyrhizobium guangzhouense]
MTDFFIGEIEMFGFNFAPKGWAQCNGQLLSIQQNQALFAVIGTAFGGNGTTNFALPDLRGRLPMGQGQGPGLSARTLGQAFGEENHTLLASETPGHNHFVNVISNPTAANASAPGPALYLSQTSFSGPLGAETDLYVVDSAPGNAMNPTAVGLTGGQPHSNQMPTIVLNYCICLSGIFPSRN